MNRPIALLTCAVVLAASGAAAARQAGQAHHLDARGKQVMGFDQQKTTHHFLLYEDGGAIDVSVKDSADETNLKAIRDHLPHIAHLFSAGQFDAPMLVHDRKDVPGTADLARLKDRVKYAYVETKTGGRVNIVTTDKAALAAVHAFLRFQITDHETGDSLSVGKRK
jgi:hypothetical protein